MIINLTIWKRTSTSPLSKERARINNSQIVDRHSSSMMKTTMDLGDWGTARRLTPNNLLKLRILRFHAIFKARMLPKINRWFMQSRTTLIFKINNSSCNSSNSCNCNNYNSKIRFLLSIFLTVAGSALSAKTTTFTGEWSAIAARRWRPSRISMASQSTCSRKMVRFAKSPIHHNSQNSSSKYLWLASRLRKEAFSPNSFINQIKEFPPLRHSSARTTTTKRTILTFRILCVCRWKTCNLMATLRWQRRPLTVKLRACNNSSK